VLVFCFGDFGGGGRVRTRNTLHILGARKSSICYNAVVGRKDENEENKENEKNNKNRNNNEDKIIK